MIADVSYKQYLLNAPGHEPGYVSLLERAGYRESAPWSGGRAGTYEIEVDIEPRHGTQTPILTVFEDPQRPILEQLDALARELNPPRT